MPKTWEQRKLGDVCERVQGNEGRMDLPTLTISAANGWMRQEDRFSSNIAGKEQKNYTLLHKGELSYNHGNSKLAKYGTVFSLETYEEALVPRVYHSFRMAKGDANFIEYYFATKIPDRELAKLISSGARMDGLLNIGFDEFMGINIKLPSVCEQEKISEYFRNLDHLITLHQRKDIMSNRISRIYKSHFIVEDRMLKIIFGNCEEAIYNTAVYFKNTYQDDWITDELSIRMIEDVDKSTVVGPRLIQSPVLGAISPRELSGGVKTLILVNQMQDKIFNASTCGDNCAKWLLEIGRKTNVTVNLRHIMDFGDGEFEIEVVNNHQVVHNMKELLDVADLLI